MSLLTSAVETELNRIEKMISDYESELHDLPKGSLSKKCIRGNEYYYLQYREGKKAVSQYIGNDLAFIEELQEQVDRRKHIEAMLTGLKSEYAKAQKMLEVAK